MPDPEKTPKPSAYEIELDREMAKARQLSVPYANYEARLKTRRVPHPPSSSTNAAPAAAQPAPAQSGEDAISPTTSLSPTTDQISAPAPPAANPTVNPAIGADDGIASVLAAQTQSLEQSAERLRTALEQNGELTNAIFTQMLAAIDGQNQKLNDVDRKISDLSGQLKSLKNP